MVSTPIGTGSFSTQTPPTTITATASSTLTQQIAPPTSVGTSFLQPTLQPGMPYMPNLLTIAGVNSAQGIFENLCYSRERSHNDYFKGVPQSQLEQHTFPVLYNSPTVIPSTTATEVQPMSLYSEYIGNPYNIQNTESDKR